MLKLTKSVWAEGRKFVDGHPKKFLDKKKMLSVKA